MKTQLLTISTVALLLIAQSASAFEQISSENDYDPAYRNGWVSAESASQLNRVSPAPVRQASTSFDQINSESGYDPAYRNGWVSAETASAINLDLMKASFRTDTVEMRGQFEDIFSIHYLTTQ